MRVQFGLNVAPGGTDRPSAGTGPWMRMVLSGTPLATIGASARYRAQGYRVLGVVTKQVAAELGSGDKGKVARAVFSAFGPTLDALQVWNEPDGAGVSSDITGKVEYNAWLAAFREEAHRTGWDKPLVAAGLVSGQPDWLRGVDMAGFRLALHPYDQRPYAGFPDWGHGNLPDLLDAYRVFLPSGTGFWLTECSRTTENAGIQAIYADALVRSVAQRTDVEACLWYCWADWWLGRALQPFGLCYTDGRPKPTLAGWTRALAEVGMATDPQWKDDKQRIEEQISLLVENQRRILMGDWDSARIFLDAIDPAMAGKWTNCHFTGCASGEV